MKKFSGLLLAAAFALGVFITPTVYQAEALEAPEALPITAENSELFLPGNYEQYLELSAPSDIAFADGYIAVADKKRIYLYERAAQAYSYYEHEYKVSKIQFSPKGTLFFSDENAQLYTLDLQRFRSESGYRAEVTTVPAATFYIDGTVLYTAAVTNRVTLYNFSLDNPLAIENALGFRAELDHNITPCLAFLNSTLYCAVGVNLYAYNMLTAERSNLYLSKTSSIDGLSSICFYGDKLYYTVKGAQNAAENGLYSTDLNGIPSRLIQEDGFTALNVCDGELYCVRKNAVNKLVVGESVTLSDYEISASSDSVSRLSSAKQAVRSGDLLVLSDSAHSCGVIVYSFSKGTYTALDATSNPYSVATDGETIAVASSDRRTISLFGKDGKFLYSNDLQTQVVGMTFVYGTCYYVTTNSSFGYLAPEGTYSEFRSSSAACSLTSDIYGNIYVGHENGSVYQFTESTFCDPNVSGSMLGFTFPSGYTSLCSDYEGNLYALCGSDVYCNGELLTSVDHTGLVFRQTPAVPIGIALGFEDGDVYFLYDNFIAKTQAIAFPTLSNIPTDGVEGDVFSNTDLSFVTVEQNAVGICTDLEALKSGAETFSYLSRTRLTEGGKGLLLAETDDYSIVVLFGDDREYFTYLIRNESCSPVPESDYWQDKKGTLYLTSDCYASLFPCLLPALRTDRLPRSTKFELVGVVQATAADFTYACVTYQTESGNKTAYLPYSYLTGAVPKEEATEYYAATLHPGRDGLLFLADDGSELLVKGDTAVEVTRTDSGLTACVKDGSGKSFYAAIEESSIRPPVSTLVRVSVIVILSVLAALIVGLYLFIRPRNVKKKSRTY